MSSCFGERRSYNEAVFRAGLLELSGLPGNLPRDTALSHRERFPDPGDLAPGLKR